MYVMLKYDITNQKRETNMAKISKRGSERYEKFVQAGLDIFLEKGYENTSLTDIIKKSGGSLASIYKFFQNKEGLFRAILERGFDQFYNKICEKIDLRSTYEIEDFLSKFATVLFDIICEKKSTLITRIVMSEGAKNDGKIGKYFLNQILDKVDKILIDFFSRENVKSKLNHDLSPTTAAAIFIALLRSPHHYYSVLLNKEVKISKKERDKYVKICVDLFLNGAIRR